MFKIVLFVLSESIDHELNRNISTIFKICQMPVHQGEGTHSFYHILCGGAVSCKAWKFIVKKEKKEKKK